MKTLLVMGLLTLSSAAFSSVVKGYDAKNSCNLYRVLYEENKTDKPRSGEVVVSTRSLYGLILENMEIDFDAREAKVQIVQNIVLGFNRPLLNNKAAIDERNPNFTKMINQLNRKVTNLDQVCVTSDNKFVYSRERPLDNK